MRSVKVKSYIPDCTEQMNVMVLGPGHTAAVDRPETEASHTSSDSLTPTTNSGPQHFSSYFMPWTVSLSVVWTTDGDSVCGILNNWVFIIHTSCWFAYIWNVFASNLSLVTSSLRWRDGTEVRDVEEEDEDRDRSNESDDDTGRESRRGRRGEEGGEKGTKMLKY